MDKLKAWIMDHKALSAGIAIALGLILYFLLFSRSQPAASGDGAVSAYYGAQAAGQQAAAAVNQSTNELAAATNQVNAAKDVALAQVQGQLAYQTQQLNAVAYQDWLGENRGTGSLIAPGTNANWIQGAGTGLLWNMQRGDQSVVADPTTGARYYGESAWSLLPTNYHMSDNPVYWSGAAGQGPVAPTATKPFVAPFTTPTIH